MRVATGKNLGTGSWAADNFHLTFFEVGASAGNQGADLHKLSGTVQKASIIRADGNGLRQLPPVERVSTCIPLLPGLVTFSAYFARDGKSLLYAVASRSQAMIYPRPWRDGKLVGASSRAESALRISSGLPWERLRFPSLNRLSPCQPLTAVGETTLDGDRLTIYKTRCIVLTLQIEFPSDPYTFTLLDGDSFTSFGIANTFITPAKDHAALYTECDANDFCSGKTVAVYAYKK